MSARITVVDGSTIDLAGVVPAGPRQPQPQPQREQLAPENEPTSLALLRVADMLDPGSPEHRRAMDLYARRYQLNKLCVSFLREQTAVARERLIAEHEEAKSAVRDGQRKLDALKSEISEMQREMNRKKDKTAAAQSRLNDAKAKRESLSRFSPRSSFLKADGEVAAARNAWEKANAEQWELQNRINAMLSVNMKTVSEELTALMNAELKAEAAIEGREVFPELGIQTAV